MSDPLEDYSQSEESEDDYGIEEEEIDDDFVNQKRPIIDPKAATGSLVYSPPGGNKKKKQKRTRLSPDESDDRSSHPPKHQKVRAQPLDPGFDKGLVGQNLTHAEYESLAKEHALRRAPGLGFTVSRAYCN